MAKRAVVINPMNKFKSKLWVLYKVEKSKFLIGSLFFLSFIIHLFLTDFEFKQSFMTALVQCLSSWILAFVFIQFRRKYYNSSLIPWWIGFYIALICLSVISLTILDYLPPTPEKEAYTFLFPKN